MHYTIAGSVVYQSNAYPFTIAAQVFVARVFPNGRRLYMDQIEACTFMQQVLKAHQTTFN
jgi:hypothetical protein